VAREAGACVESLFPTVLADGDFASVDLTSADYAQIADLVNTYASIPLGTSDASDVPIAEPLALTSGFLLAINSGCSLCEKDMKKVPSTGRIGLV
jgi:hypothetical protein